MRCSSLKLIFPVLVLGCAGLTTSGVSAALAGPDRPRYHIDASVDYALLTFQSSEQVRVPASPADPLSDVILMIYANASGIGGGDPKHGSVVVDAITVLDSVSSDGEPAPFSLKGPVLKVLLPRPENHSFTLRIVSRGVVPRSAPGGGGITDLLGGLSTDMGGLLGGADPKADAKPQRTDYGLYTYGVGILSLGSFWYPQLAVRHDGTWADQVPDGPGDVNYSDLADFVVSFTTPPAVIVAATGRESIDPARPGHETFTAPGVRDFAVLMSEEFKLKSKIFDVLGKPVEVEAFTLPADEAKSDAAIDIAGNALQIYARRFGPYAYDQFKVVEGPIRGGAGGMEFSEMTSISSSLYGDLQKQIGDLAGALGVGNLAASDAETGSDLKPAPKRGGHDPPGAEPPPSDNPATDLLKGLIGQQSEILGSIFEVSVAHEVAHQWWAISVGNDSAGAPFVDESLATYSSMIYFQDRYGAEKGKKEIDLNLKTAYATARMLGAPDAPANLPTSAYRSDMQYGAVVYGKGAYYYDVLRQALGDEAFFRCLRDYYSRYSGGSAGERSFLGVVEQECPAKKKEVDAIYARWIEQAHGDEDLTGGKPVGLEELLGGLMGGAGGLPGALTDK